MAAVAGDALLPPPPSPHRLLHHPHNLTSSSPRSLPPSSSTTTSASSASPRPSLPPPVQLLFISKGSGYEGASHVLRVVLSYLRGLWQAALSNAQTRAPTQLFSPGIEWVPKKTYAEALPG